MQVARVVLVHVILIDGVLGVIVDVLIGHDKVLVIVVIYVAIFVVIFCNWRCTLYIFRLIKPVLRLAVSVLVFIIESGRTFESLIPGVLPCRSLCLLI